jgi:hypothetical protein
MTNAGTTGHRGATTAVLLVGGGALAVATWVGGEHGLSLGLAAFYAIAAVAVFVWSGRDGDVAAILRVGGDERQRRLDLDATAYAGLAMAVAAVIGAIVSAAQHHGAIGQYGVICVVGGVSYVVSLAVLKLRTG